MNQFNLLPPELIEFIFKQVNLGDLINLRIVDRRFKQICDQFKIEQLCVYDNSVFKRSYFLPALWFYTNDPIYTNEENIVKISKFPNYKSIFRLDKYLRRLSIRLNEDFNFSILNEFKLLEQLSMKICYPDFISIYDDNNELILNRLKIASIKVPSDYKLCLDNLKIASIQLPIDFKLTLNTNKLFAFKSSELNQFILNYPNKILFYQTNRRCNYDKIQIFNNLEYLKLNWVDNPIDRDILFKFKNLKIFDLTIRYSFYEQREYDNLKNEIISILDKKENLRRSELQIYFYGVKLIDQNQLNQLKWSDNCKEFYNNVLEFQLKNYDLLKDNCCSKEEINYCDLIKLIKIIPSSFTNRFSNIHQVYTNDHIDNEDQFIKFLNGLPYLYELKLINCGLTNSFYDKLINLVYLNDLKYLICLEIEEKEELGLNFDFILNLKQLYSIHTDQPITNYFDLIAELFKSNQNLRSVIFTFDTKYSIYTSKYTSKSCSSNVFQINYCYNDDSKLRHKFTINGPNLDRIILISKNGI